MALLTQEKEEIFGIYQPQILNISQEIFKPLTNKGLLERNPPALSHKNQIQAGHQN